MHIIITGASSGIGAAIAHAFAALPETRITLVARRTAELGVLAAALPCQTHIAAVDLAAVPQSFGWLEAAIAKHGPVDVLVNNAGVQLIGATEAIDPIEGERSVQLNLLAPIRLMQAVLPSMRERQTGHIINIASMAALAPTPRMTYYNASKAGLAAASEAMVGELRGTGIHVLTVYPGIIGETAMAKRALDIYAPSRLLAWQPTGTSAALARHIVASLERRRPRLIYPRINTMARWFPAPTRWLMDRFTPGLREDTAGPPLRLPTRP